MSQPPQQASIQPVPMLDFSRGYSNLRQELLLEIERVCDSQRFILGPDVEIFERAAAPVCGVPFVIGCSSGTDALWLALAALDLGPGCTVATSPFTFFASVSAILRTGARPVLADIDPDTFNLAPSAIQKVCASQSVDAVMPVHLYGQCADMDSIGTVAAQFGLKVVEDAAQAIGSTWNGAPAGSLGDAAAFSFYPTKNLAAMGDAGMVTTASSETADHLRSLRAHGMKVRYYHEEVGWNCRLDSIQAAVLTVRLRHLDAANARRRQIAARYDALFHNAGLSARTATEGIVLPITDPRAGHTFHQYVIRAPRRDDLREFLTRHGIGSEIYYPVPLHLQQALASLGYKPGDFPESERASNEVLALPIYPELRDDEQQSVVEAIRRFYA